MTTQRVYAVLRTSLGMAFCESEIEMDFYSPRSVVYASGSANKWTPAQCVAAVRSEWYADCAFYHFLQHKLKWTRSNDECAVCDGSDTVRDHTFTFADMNDLRQCLLFVWKSTENHYYYLHLFHMCDHLAQCARHTICGMGSTQFAQTIFWKNKFSIIFLICFLFQFRSWRKRHTVVPCTTAQPHTHIEVWIIYFCFVFFFHSIVIASSIARQPSVVVYMAKWHREQYGSIKIESFASFHT